MTTPETDTPGSVSEQGAHVTPGKAHTKKGATRKTGARKAAKAAKGATSKSAKASKKSVTREPKATTPRAESKGAKILDLMRRPKGATLAELARLTGWQNHSIRGFLSGTVGKKMGIAVASEKREAGERVYSISK